MDITLVRKKLWDAYNRLGKTKEGIEGKTSEAWVEVYYPTYWDCVTEDDFLTPKGFMVFSYALGPSRRHYFNFSSKESHPNYYTWESPDPVKTAVDVIERWIKEIEENEIN